MTTMSRNQQDAAARKRHRERRIAQVQRERDIAEVFGVETMFDILRRELRADGTVNAQLILDGSNVRAPILDHEMLEVERIEDTITYILDWSIAPDALPQSNAYFVNYRDISAIAYGERYMEIPLAGVGFGEFLFDNESQSLSCTVAVFAKAEGAPKEVMFGLLIYESAEWTITIPNRFNSWNIRLGAELCYQAIWVVSLISKTNTVLVDQPPNPRLSAISEREFGRPLTTYKVLKVNTGHKEYYGRDKDTGLRDFDPRRMHVVRGHYNEYGTNGRKLLFGKYQRKIWIPAHVRGNEELGIVVKDYEVVNNG